MTQPNAMHDADTNSYDASQSSGDSATVPVKHPSSFKAAEGWGSPGEIKHALMKIGRSASTTPGETKDSPVSDKARYSDVDMQQRVADWDAEVEKQQVQLCNEQWRLLRTQIGSLSGALTEMQTEIKKIRALAATQEDDKTSMESRLSYIEDFLGSGVDTKLQDLASADDSMQYLHKAVSAGAKTEHLNMLYVRMTNIENTLTSKTDDHFTELADTRNWLETRVDLMECSRLDHEKAVFLENRVDFLEKKSSARHRELDAKLKQLGALQQLSNSQPASPAVQSRWPAAVRREGPPPPATAETVSHKLITYDQDETVAHNLISFDQASTDAPFGCVVSSYDQVGSVSGSYVPPFSSTSSKDMQMNGGPGSPRSSARFVQHIKAVMSEAHSGPLPLSMSEVAVNGAADEEKLVTR